MLKKAGSTFPSMPAAHGAVNQAASTVPTATENSYQVMGALGLNKIDLPDPHDSVDEARIVCHEKQRELSVSSFT